MTPDEQLRDWAIGDRARAAAVELLIRSGLAADRFPWVLQDTAWNTRAIDFDLLHDTTDTLADGHASVLRIAASLADGTPIDLRASATGLDRALTELVMIAIAHAAGYTEFTSDIDTNGQCTRIVPIPPLATWPE